jgi:hypothetical protein
MWTHQMPGNSRIRQEREEIYRRWSTKELEMLHKLAHSQTKELRQFGEHWREDYRLWLEDRQAKEAA